MLKLRGRKMGLRGRVRKGRRESKFKVKVEVTGLDLDFCLACWSVEEYR